MENRLASMGVSSRARGQRRDQQYVLSGEDVNSTARGSHGMLRAGSENLKSVPRNRKRLTAAQKQKKAAARQVQLADRKALRDLAKLCQPVRQNKPTDHAKHYMGADHSGLIMHNLCDDPDEGVAIGEAEDLGASRSRPTPRRSGPTSAVKYGKGSLIFVKLVSKNEPFAIGQLCEHVIEVNHPTHGVYFMPANISLRYFGRREERDGAWAIEMEDAVSRVDRGSIHGQVECFETLSKKKQSGLYHRICIPGDEWDRMAEKVAKADQVADGRDYLDEEDLNDLTPAMLAASRGVANSGADVADDFLSQGGAGMEAPSSREHYAEREVLFNAKQSELGKVLNKGSKEYDRLLAEVDAELLARSSQRPQAGSDNRRRGTRHRNQSSMGLMSAAYQGEQQNPKRQKSSRT